MDVGHVIETALAQAPAILIAAGGIIVALRKGQQTIVEQNEQIKTQLDGHTTRMVELADAQGQLKGIIQAKKQARLDNQNTIKRIVDVVPGAVQRQQNRRRKLKQRKRARRQA